MIIMNDKTLLSIAFVTALAGLFLLIRLELQEPAEYSAIDQINQLISLKGELRSIKSSVNSAGLVIQHTETIPVVLYGKIPYPIEKGESVEVIGRPDDNGGIVAEEVRVI